MNQIKLIEKSWRIGLISLVVSTMLFGGLLLNIKAADASGTPNMTIRHLGANASTNRTWDHNVSMKAGDEVDFYAEIHNTVVGTRAEGVTIKVNAPSGNFVDGTSVATVTADNANSASDTVNLHIDNGGSMEFIANSTRVTWDVNGDGNYEFKDTYVAGNPFNGLRLGQQDGCNNFIIQIAWAVRVKEGPQPSPSPSPSPTPSPTPSVSPSPSPSPTPTPVVSPSPSSTPAIVNNNSQEQHQEQNNNQTVNITNTGAVAGAKVPAKTPETGISVLGLTSMFGAGPVGFALSRFGRGRTVGKKDDEETLSEIANNLHTKRNKRS